MRKLWNRLLDEPAVAVGVLAAAIILAFKLANHEAITADDVIQILAPLGGSLGTRRLVLPAHRLQPSSDAPAAPPATPAGALTSD